MSKEFSSSSKENIELKENADYQIIEIADDIENYSDSFESDESDNNNESIEFGNEKKVVTELLVEKGGTLKVLGQRMREREIEGIQKIDISRDQVKQESVMLLFLGILSIESFVLGELYIDAIILYAIVLSFFLIISSLQYLLNQKVKYFSFIIFSILVSFFQLFFISKYLLKVGIGISFIEWFKCYVPGVITALLYIVGFSIIKNGFSFHRFNIEYPHIRNLWIHVFISSLLYFLSQFFLVAYDVEISYVKNLNIYFHNIIVWIFYLIMIAIYGNSEIRKVDLLCIICAFITSIALVVPYFVFNEKFLGYIPEKEYRILFFN